jgi:hypothetical protein
MMIKIIGTRYLANVPSARKFIVKKINDKPDSIPTGISKPFSWFPNIYSSNKPTAGARINPGHKKPHKPHSIDAWHMIPTVSSMPPGTNNPTFFLFV